MTIPTEIVILILGSVIALQAWTLKMVHELTIKVAVLETQLADSQKQKKV